MTTPKRITDRLRRTPPDGPRVYGTPGGSSRSIMRTGRAQWLAASWRTRLGIAAAIIAAAALTAYALGAPPAAGAAGGAAIAAIAAIALTVPEAAALTAASLAYLPFLPLLAAVYAAAATANADTPTVDLGGAALSLLLSYLAAIWIASRWSRGRRWVTVLAVAASTVIPGLLILNAAPFLGLNAARISMAAVLVARCGGWQWAIGTAGLCYDWLAARTGRITDDGFTSGSKESTQTLDAWGKRAAAERATADILAELDSGYTIFHDLRIKGGTTQVGHVVVGPGGMFLIASITTDSPITETNTDGVTIPDVPLADISAHLLDSRAGIARTTHTPDSDIPMLIVVHGNHRNVRKTLHMYTVDDPFPIGSVLLISADMLTAEIAPGFVLWGRTRCARAVRRIRMKSHSAAMPATATSPVASLAPADDKGHSQRPTSARPDLADGPPPWMINGARCRAVTTLGNLPGLRIVGTPYQEDGQWLVGVCTDDEWRLAIDAARAPRPVPYPAVSIAQPVEKPVGQ